MGGPFRDYCVEKPNKVCLAHVTFTIIQIEPNRAPISRLVRKQPVFEQLYFTIPSQVVNKVVPVLISLRTDGRTDARTDALAHARTYEHDFVDTSTQ